MRSLWTIALVSVSVCEGLWVLWNIDTRIRDVNSGSSFVRTENKVESHHGGGSLQRYNKDGSLWKNCCPRWKEKQNGMQHADNGVLRLTWYCWHCRVSDVLCNWRLQVLCYFARYTKTFIWLLPVSYNGVKYIFYKCEDENTQKPLTAPVLLKAHAVFDCSDVGIVGSNSAPGMDGSSLLMCLCCRV